MHLGLCLFEAVRTRVPLGGCQDQLMVRTLGGSVEGSKSIMAQTGIRFSVLTIHIMSTSPHNDTYTNKCCVCLFSQI